MKQMFKPRCWISMLALVIGLTTLLPLRAKADVPATQPGTQPAGDSAEVKAVRSQMLAWDAGLATISLVDYRKTFHTENDREAEYADFLAHDTWETGKTEQAVRYKWGPEADAQFCRLVGFTSREEDQACEIKLDGDHAVATWAIKDSKPGRLIKVDGHWMTDVHGMFDEWLQAQPNMETQMHPMVKLMTQARAEIADGKFDDADSFVKDLQSKMQNPEGGN